MNKFFEEWQPILGLATNVSTSRASGAASQNPYWEEGLLNPLFIKAEQERISRAMQQAQASTGESDRLPTFPEGVYDNLPYLLAAAVKSAVCDQERDIMLLGSLVVLSSCLPNVQGTDHHNQVFPNLFPLVSASASAGKGRLARCRDIDLE